MMYEFDYIYLTIALVTLSVVVLGVFIVHAISEILNKKSDALLNDSSNSLRIYIIDLKNEKVRYFNRISIQKKYNIDLPSFYAHFQENERDSLIAWVNALVDEEENAPSFKEIHVISHHRKANLFSLLQVSKVIKDKQIVYLESSLIKANLVRKNKNNNVYNFSSFDNFSKAIISQSSNRGITFAFSFFDKRSKADEIPRIVFLQFVNIFNAFVTPYRTMIEYGTHHIVVSDLHIYSRPQLMQLLASLKTDINKYLLIASLQDRIGFTIGVCENKTFYKEPERLINSVISLTDTAREENETILWYEEGTNITQNGDEAYRTEVERIIRDKKLKYGFRPIIDMEKAKVLGYQSFVEPMDSFFGSIEELKSYAVRTEDDRVLFATIARNLISRFTQEKDGDSVRLFFQVNRYELAYANRTLSHIQDIKSTHVVLVYQDKDLLDIGEKDYEDLLTEIKTFKSKGYEIALEIKDTELTLSSNIFASFDFFLIDVKANLKVGKEYSQRLLYDFRGLVEKLLKYHRPIVALDIQTWDNVELLHKLGINLVSAEVIAPRDENVLPVPQKSILKIKSITK